MRDKMAISWKEAREEGRMLHGTDTEPQTDNTTHTNNVRTICNGIFRGEFSKNPLFFHVKAFKFHP